MGFKKIEGGGSSLAGGAHLFQIGGVSNKDTHGNLKRVGEK
jgi:hypothetical protein